MKFKNWKWYHYPAFPLNFLSIVIAIPILKWHYDRKYHKKLDFDQVLDELDRRIKDKRKDDTF